jgi:hypothetical protein
LKVIAFEVVALVVDALDTAKLEVAPHNVVIVARVELSVAIVAEVIFASVAKKFVDDALVNVELVLFKLVNVPVVPVI